MKTNYKPFYSILENNASHFPGKTFITSIDQSKSIQYGQMYEVCNQIGNFLKNNGIKENDRILLLAENSLEYLIFFMGILGYGATLCPINIEINEKIIKELIERIQPKMVFYDKALTNTDLRKEVKQEWIFLGEWNPEETEKRKDKSFFALLASPKRSSTSAGR